MNNIKFNKFVMLGFLVFLFWSHKTIAQGVTASSISGKVTDIEGDELANASVIAVHIPSGTQYGISTRLDGRFALPNMRIGGPYSITVSYIGYEEQKIEGINLKLGETLNFNFELEEASTQLGEVVITAVLKSEIEKTGSSNVFDNETIRIMPTITRSAADIYRLTPSSDGNSFAGRNDQYNNFSLNGLIFNNPFGLDAATPGGQTDAQPISLDAIDQIQVTLAPFDATMSGFTGASINAVTKSGTNTLSGTVFSYYRSEAFTGTKIRGESVLVPDLTQLQSGFSLGGPIVKNKAFFFVNFEMERRDDLGSSFRAKRDGLSGNDVSRVEATDLELLSHVLDSAFGYKTGTYEGFTHNTDNGKGIVKLDFNISKNHTITAIYNFLNASKDKPAHPSAFGRRGPDATTLQFYNSGYRINNKIDAFSIEVRSFFRNSISNKFQAGYTHFDDTRDPFSTPFPVINILNNGIRYIVAGHEPFSIHNTLDQKVFQVNDVFELYFDAHSLKGGLAFEKFQFDNSFNINAYGGTFNDYSSLQSFLDTIRSGNFADDVQAAINTHNINESNDSWALAEINIGQLSGFFHDKWVVSDLLSLNLGIRIDMPLYFDTKDKIEENIARNCCYDPSITYFDASGNPITFNQTDLPKNKILLSPRFGFNYQNRNNSITIRGGSGLFTGRFPFVWIGNQVANPNYFFYNMTSSDFKFPQVWRSSLGVDKKFGKSISTSIDITYTKDINAMLVRNYGLNLPSGNLMGVDNRTIYLSADRTTPYANNAYVFTNTHVGRTFNITYEIEKKWSMGLYSRIAYNYLDAKDASSIEAEISSDAYDRNPALGHVNQAVLAPSVYGNKHRIVGSINYIKKYGSNSRHTTTLSMFLEYAQGGRFNYTYSGDINNDGSSLNDLIYIPTEDDLESMNFTGTDTEADNQRKALNDFIIQDQYLKHNRGKYAEKYGILSPWYSRFDIRLLHNIIIKNSHALEFSFDVLNIGNLISSNWGVRQFPTNTQPIGVTVADGVPTYSFDTNLNDTFIYDASLLSRWQMQFGVRYNF